MSKLDRNVLNSLVEKSGLAKEHAEAMKQRAQQNMINSALDKLKSELHTEESDSMSFNREVLETLDAKLVLQVKLPDGRSYEKTV